MNGELASLLFGIIPFSIIAIGTMVILGYEPKHKELKREVQH